MHRQGCSRLIYLIATFFGLDFDDQLCKQTQSIYPTQWLSRETEADHEAGLEVVGAVASQVAAGAEAAVVAAEEAAEEAREEAQEVAEEDAWFSTLSD